MQKASFPFLFTYLYYNIAYYSSEMYIVNLHKTTTYRFKA